METLTRHLKTATLGQHCNTSNFENLTRFTHGSLGKRNDFVQQQALGRHKATLICRFFLFNSLHRCILRNNPRPFASKSDFDISKGTALQSPLEV